MKTWVVALRGTEEREWLRILAGDVQQVGDNVIFIDGKIRVWSSCPIDYVKVDHTKSK